MIQEEYENDINRKKFISKEDAKKTEHNSGFHGTSGTTQGFSCPACGSYNTGQSTYVEYCNTCDWVQGY